VVKIFFASDTEEKDFNTEGTENTEKDRNGASNGGHRSGWITKHQWRAVFTVLNYLAALCVFLPLSAQQQGR